jgi:hypothetical protein
LQSEKKHAVQEPCCAVGTSCATSVSLEGLFSVAQMMAHLLTTGRANAVLLLPPRLHQTHKRLHQILTG